VAFGKLTLGSLMDDLGGPRSSNGAIGLTTLALGFLLVALFMMAAGFVIDGVRRKESRVVARPDPIPVRRGPLDHRRGVELVNDEAGPVGMSRNGRGPTGHRAGGPGLGLGLGVGPAVSQPSIMKTHAYEPPAGPV
jgi:hypothetical protein